MATSLTFRARVQALVALRGLSLARLAVGSWVREWLIAWWCWKVRAKDAGGFAGSLNANRVWSGYKPA